ncbi:MAG: hypothetical protein K6F69_08880, partial [Treponema sp.]|nr:hypothetical protein [Treponema sp.]
IYFYNDNILIILIKKEYFKMAILKDLKVSVTGKCNNLVYECRNGVTYVKQYSKPKNPRSEAQQINRNAFALIAKFAKKINPLVLKPYSPPLYPKNTFRRKPIPYNLFCKINKGKVLNGKLLYSSLQFFEAAFSFDAKINFVKKDEKLLAVKFSDISKKVDKIICCVEEIASENVSVFEFCPSEDDTCIFNRTFNPGIRLWFVTFKADKASETVYMEY